MVKTWLLRLWSWVRGLFRTEVPVREDLTGKPFKYARIMKSSRGMATLKPTWPEPARKLKWEGGKSPFPDSGLPGCKHVRSVPNGLPPELYSECGIDPYSVAGYFMNSGDLYAQCQDCQHERVYPKAELHLFEMVAVGQAAAGVFGFDVFDKQLYRALKQGRVGDSATPVYDTVMPR